MPSPKTEIHLPDVNVLFAVLAQNHAAHALALAWFRETSAFVTTPMTELGVLRLSTNPAFVIARPTWEDAQAALGSIRRDSRACFLDDNSTLAEPFIDLRGLSGYRQVPDFHLANLAAKHGMTLVTLDRRLYAALQPTDRSRVRLLG